MEKNISYERWVYESVDDKNIILGNISKFDGKMVSESNGLKIKIAILDSKVADRVVSI